jgi:hypothetical protein
MFYTIYKITNNVNNKIYIGKHQTKNLDDNYMGSGKHLKYAINKYGIENFTKEILFQFDNEIDMNTKEAELVTEEFCLSKNTYNLCPGGRGGFGYINNEIMTTDLRKSYGKINGRAGGIALSERLKNDNEYRNKFNDHLKDISKKAEDARKIKYPNGTFHGKKHTDEWRQNHSSLMKEKSNGPNNSNYGKKYIYSLTEKRSLSIPKDDPVPDGWMLGRKIKF